MAVLHSTPAASRRVWFLLLTVLLLLFVLDVSLRGVFFERSVLTHYVAPYPILRDRTFSQNWSILFGALHRLPRSRLRVAVLGDSTVFATEPYGDEACIALLLREELRRRYPAIEVEVVDLSELGLFTSDAALILTKLVQEDVDAIVYAATLREFPTRPPVPHMSSLWRELSAFDIARLVAVDGDHWLSQIVDAEALAHGLVHSSWALYAYRVPLKRLLWRRGVLPLVENHPGVRDALEPGYRPQPIREPQRPKSSVYRWTREEFGFPNANWEALTIMTRLCARYAPGRCLVYAGPVNPAVRATLAEPGLYEEYLARVQDTVTGQGLLWRSFSDALPPEQFRRPTVGETDPIHMNRTGGVAIVAMIADALEGPLGARLRSSRDGEAPVQPPR